MQLFRAIALLIFYAQLAMASQETPQTFTLDGRLYSDASGSTPLSDSLVTLTIQVLDKNQSCVLYEEVQTANTQSSNGYFSVQVGSSTGALKRTTVDSGNSMAVVFANSGASILGKQLSDLTTVCFYTPAAGEARYVRVQVKPSSDNVTRVLTPYMAMTSIPSAVVAERAENLQGLTKNNFLQVNTTAPNSLTQTNLESVFTSTNFSRLTTLLSVPPSNYVQTGSNGAATVPSVSGNPSSGLAVGQIWYDSVSNTLKYYDGSVKTLGTGGGSGITNIATGTGLLGGPITSTGTLSVDVGTTVGKIVQVQTGGKLPALDGSNLTGLTAAQISSGTLTIAQGGTGQSTKTAAFDALSPNTTKGDITVRDGSNNVRLPIGSNGQVLMADSSQSTGVKWGNAATGTLTSLTAGTGLTGGSITTTGTINVDVGTGANQIVQLTAASKLPAVDGSSLTNLTASQISAGTLPTNRGGTGNGSFAAHSVIVSDLTGSQLQSLNCGSGQVLKFDASGYAICGTDNGATGNEFLNGGNSFGAAANFGTNDAYALNIKTNNTARMTFDNAGNVGIGTATPAGILDVRGGTAAASTSGSDINIVAQNGGAGGASGGNINLTPGAGSSSWPSGMVGIIANSGQQVFYVDRNATDSYAASDSSMDSPVLNSRFANTWSADGNTALLGFTVRNTAATVQKSYFGALAVPGSQGPALVWGQKTGATSYQESMRLDTSGNLGIGTTAPKSKLQSNLDNTTGYQMGDQFQLKLTNNQPVAVGQIVGLGYGFTQNSNDYVHGYDGLIVTSAGSQGLADRIFVLWDGTNQNEKMRLTSSGNLGIGTNAPNTALDVNGAVSVRGLASAPANAPAGQGRIFFDSTANKFKVSENNGAYVDLVGSGGTSSDATYAAKGIVQFNTNAATSGISLSSGVATVNSGTGANQIVKLDGSAKLPAVDGSALTNLNPSNLSGAVPISLGGTGQTTQTAGFNALSPLTTKGDLIVSNGTNNVRLPAGSDGQVLSADSSQGSGLKWIAVGGTGSVTNVSAGTGLTGGTITSTGTLNVDVGTGANQIVQLTASSKLPAVDGSLLTSLTASQISAGTLPTNRGGTGNGTFTAHSVIVSDLTGSQLQSLNCGSGQVLKFDASGYAICGTDNGATGNEFVNGGNSFTAAANLGTNDAYALNIKTNNTTRMTFDSAGNVGIGTTSPGAKLEVAGQVKITGGSPGAGKVLTSDAAGLATWQTPSGGGSTTSDAYNNTKAGTNALAVVNGSGGGTDNTAFGYNSLAANTTGSFNVAVGSSVLNSNTTGNGNVAIGNVLSYNTTGSHNIGIGDSALSVNSTGNYNVAIGKQSLESNTGNSNVAVGIFSLYKNTSGSSNSAHGDSSLFNNTTGASNSAFGSSALDNVTTGNNNVAIGTGAGTNANGASSGNVFIGYSAGPSSLGAVSNKLYIANAAGTPLIYGDFSAGTVGIGTTSPNTALDINGAESMRGMSAPAVSPAGQGRIYFDSAANKFKVSQNGAAYVDLVGGGGSGITSLNGASGSSQTFATPGTSGTAPAWSTDTSTGIHTLNLPMASASSVTAGLISKSDYDAFMNKLGTTTSFSGDVSGAYSATSVDKIKGTGVSVTSLTSGNFLKYNGSAWVNSMLDVSDIGTGTLAVARGGTGASSFNANKIVGTNGTGSALQSVVCSQNQVISFDASGNYGCYNVSSLVAGFVNGGNSFTATGSLGTNDAYALNIKTNNTTRMTFDTAGNVGIGTTSPSSLLHVQTTAAAAQAYVVGRFTGYNSAETTGSTTRLVIENTSNPGTDTNGGKIFLDGIRTATNMDFAVSLHNVYGGAPTERMRLTGSGNLGVGMSNPGHTLSVLSSGQNAIVNLYGVTAPTDYGVLEVTSAGGGIASGSPRPLSFQPNGGNVSIGGTDPQSKLEILATSVPLTTTAGELGIYTTDTQAADKGATITMGGQDGSATRTFASIGGLKENGTVNSTAGYLAFTTRADGGSLGEAMRISSTGKVGIGTTNPGVKLDVVGDVRVTSGQFYGSQISDGSGQYVNLNSGSSNLNFGTGSSTRMRIDSSGNVGIGTTAPNTILDINGAESMRGIAAPSVSPTGQGRIYFDSTSNKYKVSENGGAFVDLVGSGGGGGASDFANGGNSFAGTATLGTNDLNGLDIRTSTTTRMSIASTGAITVYSTLNTNQPLNLNQDFQFSGTRYSFARGTNTAFFGPSSGNKTFTGTDDTGIGYNTLSALTTGAYNTGVGSGALAGNTSSNYNTAVGVSALNVDTGGYNTAVGAWALKVTTGSENSAVGMSALLSNTSGAANTAIGYYALKVNTTASYNTAVGDSALLLNTGVGNTALGYMAGYTATSSNANTTGTYNTYIGYDAGPGTATQLDNTIAIGNGSRVTASNQAVIGNASITQTLLNGNVGIGTSTTNAKLEVAGNVNVSGRIVSGAATNSNALSSITVDFTNTNTVRVTGASAACGTLNVTNIATGGYFTVTIPNATASCTTLQWNGSTTNVKLPSSYTTGATVNGIVYTFLSDGTTLWVSPVGF